MTNSLIDVSIKTMVGQLPDIITKNNHSINDEFDKLYQPAGYLDNENPTVYTPDTLILPVVDTTKVPGIDGLVISKKIQTDVLNVKNITFPPIDPNSDQYSETLNSKYNIVKDVSHNALRNRYLWKRGANLHPEPILDVSVVDDMRFYSHNAGAIGVIMANNPEVVKSLAEVINEMINDIDSMKTTYAGGNAIGGGDGYVNIYGAAKKGQSSLSEPDSFTFDNNVLFSTKTQLKRMNLIPYQYNDISDGFIYTYYNYASIITISDEHTASLTGIPGNTVQIKFNDQKKKAYYRIILSRKEKKFLRVSKDELVRLYLTCISNSDEFGSEWDVESYSVRNSEDLVIERK